MHQTSLIFHFIYAILFQAACAETEAWFTPREGGKAWQSTE
jgi:hypothetical protein